MNITARIIQDSISLHTGTRITTFELEFPRIILSQVNTHKMLSKNTSSSRAIPVTKMLEQIKNNPAMPVHWGKNQSGMQANEGLNPATALQAEQYWQGAKNSAIEHAKVLQELGVHKQITNRLTEPFQMVKMIMTSTSYDNFFNLRRHKDAQPEIYALADAMYQAYMGSKPLELEAGEWHVPYIGRMKGKIRDGEEGVSYIIKDNSNGKSIFLSVEEAIKISCSACAQVSYRKLDTSVEKALEIYDKLAGSNPIHASSFEHCATPIEYRSKDETKWYVNTVCYPESWQDGITHMDRSGRLYSGNFKDWIQYRQLIPNHTCWDYKP